MHPAIYEALILAVVGASAVSAGYLMGLRRVVPLIVAGFGAAVVLRVVTLLLSWSLSAHSLGWELWLASSLLVTVAGVWLGRRDGVLLLRSLGGIAALSLVALATKYLFDIGEKEHNDSLSSISISLFFIQTETSDISFVQNGVKRGLAFPAMLALGPEGRLLGGFTPLLFLILIAGVLWLARDLTRDVVPIGVYWTAVTLIGAFSISTPIFRAAMFYLNAHTLMSLGLFLLLMGMLEAQRKGHFGLAPSSMALVGGMLSSTARAEGIVPALVVLGFIAASPIWTSAVERVRLAVVISATGVVFAWWLIAIGSDVPAQYGISGGLLIALSITGGVLAALPLWDRLRWLIPYVFAAIVLGYLATVVWSSSRPVPLVLTQWPNLVEGVGGWGSAALVSGVALLTFGWSSQPSVYRKLVGIALLLLATTLLTKTFDGGFGRPSFFDSVNRMWLHTMPIIALATIIGAQTLLRNLLQTGRTRQ